MARGLARRRRNERIGGALIALLGVVVAVIAFLALHNPKPSGTSAGSASTTSSPSVSVSTSRRSSTGTSPVSRSSRPTSRASSRSATSSTGGSTRPTTSRPNSSTASGAVGSQPLVVLNQGLLNGTAAAAARRFEQAGWTVSSLQENYVNDVVTTTAYYDPAVSGAQAAAQALARQFPTIHRVTARFSNLVAGPVVVVLTNDYSPN